MSIVRLLETGSLVLDVLLELDGYAGLHEYQVGDECAAGLLLGDED